MGKMKKLIKILSLLMAGLMSWFSPIQMANAGMCCLACQLKKEEDIKIELPIEEVDDKND
jgi:hypothetical protein|tara:strand:+ start:290 stop:469 length:180 start_codon:yes stop_codon:yes gene_type:complete